MLCLLGDALCLVGCCCCACDVVVVVERPRGFGADDSSGFRTSGFPEEGTERCESGGEGTVELRIDASFRMRRVAVLCNS
jgi:hypothetical protein